MIWMSLHNWSLIEPTKWVGLANFVRAWNDRQFWMSLGFTLKYTAYITPILMIGGYLIALLVAQQHAAAAIHSRHCVRSGGHRARRLEPALVLAVQLRFRPHQPAARRSRHRRPARRLVRRGRRPGALGGHRFDRLEGARLRHAAVRRRDPGDPPARSTRPRWSTAPATGSACSGSRCR